MKILENILISVFNNLVTIKFNLYMKYSMNFFFTYDVFGFCYFSTSFAFVINLVATTPQGSIFI